MTLKRNISLWIQSIIVVLLVGSGSIYVFKPDLLPFSNPAEPSRENVKGKKKGDRKVPVIAEQVIEATNDSIIEAIGDGRASRFVTLFAESPGEVVAINVRAGQAVKKSDAIIELDSRKAELAVQVARTKLVEAERKAQRSEQLHQRNVNSQANVDDAETLLNRAKLELQQAQEALKDRFIRAPFDGIVGIPKVETGERVTTETAIVTLDDRSALTVEFDIPEYFHTQIKVGEKIIARTPGHGSRVFNGSVRAIDSRIDSTNRSVKVRAEIPNVNDVLRPGMSFAVQIVIKGKPYPSIPELALQWGKGKSYVWKIENGQARKVDVNMVKRVNSSILVEGDIAKSDLIVVEGVQRLRDGVALDYSEPAKTGEKVSRLESEDGRKRQ